MEAFGASIALKDNVSGVLKQARDSSKKFSGEVEKAKKRLEALDKQKVREKELKLKNTKAYKTIEGVKKKLEPITKKVIELKAKEEKALDKIKKVKKQLDKINGKKIINMTVKGAAGVTKALGKAAIVGAAGAFTAVAVASAAAVTSAADYQAQMQNVGTLLAGDVNGKLKAYSAQLKSVSNDTGIATSDLTDGLYQVVSAFGESAENVKQLEIAAKAAKAGNATTTDSVNLLSAVTKAYGDTSAEAMQKASDLAFMTVKLGQTTYPEMAASMGGVIAMSSQLGVSQEALYGTMATLTGVTGNTAEVSTQLEGVLSGFLSPTEELEKALKKMGYSSGAAALEAEGLEGIITKLQEQVGGSSLDLANLFSDTTAKQALLALTGDLSSTWKEKTAAMSEASGATEQAFQTQQNSLKAMAGKVKNFGQNMLTSIGEQALPYLQSGFEKLIAKMPEIESVVSSIVAKVGPAIEQFGSIAMQVFEDWKPAIQGLEPALKQVGSIAIKVFDQWKPAIQEISSVFATAFQSISPCINNVLLNFEKIIPCIQPVVTSVGTTLAALLPVVGGIFSGISSVVAEVFPVIAEIVTSISSKLQEAFSGMGGATSALSAIFEIAGPAISGVLSTAWSIMEPILDVALECIGLISDAIGVAFPYIQSAIESVWVKIEPIITLFVEGIKGIAQGAKDAISSVRGLIGGGDESVDANATGTSYYGGGWTTVGEHGPELMKLPSGTEIKSNTASQSMGGGKNYSINIEKLEVRNDSDIDAVAEAIVRKIEEAEDNM